MNSPAPATASDDTQLLGELSQGGALLRERIGRVVIGQDAVVDHLLAAIFCEGHALLVGVPGLAKTLLVKTLAEALGWRFKRIQFTPDLMPADIVGTELLQEGGDGERAWRFKPGPIFTNLLLADEINRTPPKTQAALLEAMQEYQVTSLGSAHPIEKPFVVVATQNPIEQEGTYPLPEAQLDRFMFSLRVAYPQRDAEERIVAATTVPHDDAVEPVFDVATMHRFQDLVRRLPAAPHVVRYAVALARATRPDDPLATDMVRQCVEWGAGPRGGQFLILAGKAAAAMAGRPAVNAEDVRAMALPVLRHRVLTNYHAAGEGIDADRIVRDVLERTSEDA